MTLTRKELDAWTDYQIGKPCPIHGSVIKSGKLYGNWCGNKDEWGTWCNGGSPTEEWLINFRKEQHE